MSAFWFGKPTSTISHLLLVSNIPLPPVGCISMHLNSYRDAEGASPCRAPWDVLRSGREPQRLGIEENMTCCSIHLRRCSNIVNTETEQQLDAATVQKYIVVMLAIYFSFAIRDSNKSPHVCISPSNRPSADAYWQACCVQSVQLFVLPFPAASPARARLLLSLWRPTPSPDTYVWDTKRIGLVHTVVLQPFTATERFAPS